MTNDRRADLDNADIDGDLAPGRRRRLSHLAMPGGDDREIEASADQLGRAHGANRQMAPDPAPAAAELPAPAPAPLPAATTPLEPPAPVDTVRLVSVHVEMPEYLSDKLAFDALMRKTTKQHLILEALKALGYDIRDQDMVADRRRRSKK